MSRINTNVGSLIAQRVLGQNNQALSLSLERLSTGLKINRGADDPAGLIGSENLRAEKAAIGAAVNNAERAEQVVNIAEGGLQEISGLLTELNGLVTTSANSAGLSAEEKEANQLQIDSILQTINRLAGATSFQGNKLLNGSLSYITSSVSAEVADFTVNGAKLDIGQTLGVDVTITQSAQAAGLYLSIGAALALGASTDQFVIEITGAKGSRELSFASGVTPATIATAINSFVDVTGVSAALSGGSLRLDSDAFGSNNSVGLKIIDDGNYGSAAGIGIYQLSGADTNAVLAGGAVTLLNSTAASNGLQDKGQDVGATINGIVATSKGTKASINSDFLSVEIDLAIGAGTANAQNTGAMTAFTITGGGANFQLASNVDIAGKVSLGIDNVAINSLGRTTKGTVAFTLSDLSAGKTLNVVDGNTTTAQNVLRSSIKEINALRGRLGAFQKNTVGATIRSLGISLENTTAAESAIRDADFASETASLTRAQILVSSTTNVLGIANSQPQNVLQLLG